MKDNKLYKVLRIIFLTLAILSMVFSLSKKFVHAEGSASSFPLPYGAGSHYGYGTYDLTQSDIESTISLLQSNSITPTAFFVYEIGSNDSYIDLVYTTTPVYVALSNNSTYPGFNTPVLFFRSSTNGDYTYGGVVRVSSSGGSIISSGLQQEMRIDINNHLVQGSIPQNSYILYYPVYYTDNATIPGYGWVGNSYSNELSMFTYAGTGGGGGIDSPGFGQGSIIGEVTDYDGRGFNYDLDISIDLDPLQVLGEEIRDGIGTLKDRVVEGFQTIGGKIDSFKDRVVQGFQTLATIPSKVSDIYDYITEPFDEEKFSEKFEEMELGQELTTFRTDIESFTGTFNVSPAAAEDVRFSIPFTLPYVNQNLQAVIDFSFYDRIRSIVVPFFTVFLIFGMVWSLIRSIPGILHGSSPDGDS